MYIDKTMPITSVTVRYEMNNTWNKTYKEATYCTKKLKGCINLKEFAKSVVGVLPVVYKFSLTDRSPPPMHQTNTMIVGCRDAGTPICTNQSLYIPIS